jgi:16S rRNA U1498 N3-methylase RsmE
MHTKGKIEESKLLKDIDFTWEKIINLFVWPEGWFSDDEVWRFWKNNFERLFLWDRILRTELAWISSSFCIIQNK